MKSSELIGKKVIIAPFSTDAIFLYHQLIHDGVNVVAFLDKDLTLHDKLYSKTMIIPYFHFDEIDFVVIIANPGYVEKDEVYKELIVSNYRPEEILRQKDIEFGCSAKQIADCINFKELSEFRNFYWMLLLKTKFFAYTVDNGLEAEILDLIVTTRCSLKCSGCGTLMDYFRPYEQRDQSLEKLISSFDRLMRHFDFVREVIPIGGEPFLYKDLDKLLLHIVNSDTRKIGSIPLLTNGTVIPSDKVLEIMDAHRELFKIQISDYGATSSKKFELASLLNQHKFVYYCKPMDSWYSFYQPVVPSSNMTENEIKALGAKCRNCTCYHGGQLRVLENRVFSCCFMAFGTACHVLPDDKRNYLDIDYDVLSKDVLRKFMTDVHPGAAYCGAQRSYLNEKEFNKPIPVAQQATKVHECTRYE